MNLLYQVKSFEIVERCKYYNLQNQKLENENYLKFFFVHDINQMNAYFMKTKKYIYFQEKKKIKDDEYEI